MWNLNTFYMNSRRRAGRARQVLKLHPPSISWAIRRILQPEFNLPASYRMTSGVKLYLGDSVDDGVVKSYIESHDTYFPSSFQLPNNALIVDIGAHRGFWTLEALWYWKNARVIAIEPEPQAASHIRDQVKYNKCGDRCEVVEAAIGDGVEQKLELHYSTRSSLGNTTYQLKDGESGRFVEVRALSMQEILKGRRPDLFKCNAEGAEYKAVPQLLVSKTLPKYMMLAIHPEYGDARGLISTLSDAGYSVMDVGTERRPYYHCNLVNVNGD